ncbi:P-loop NTPase [bacterium]|nr:P-loop NTPase [bacterium]
MTKISVASGKGGTGKTTLSLALAELMSSGGSVEIVDLDVEEPDVELFVESTKIKQEVVYAPVSVWKESSCTSCGLCSGTCANHALVYFPGTVMIFPEMCKGCGHCVYHCPTDALALGKKRIGEITRFSAEHFSLLEGRLDIGVEQPVPMILATKKESQTKQKELFIFDAPPGSSCPSQEAMKDVDMIILVTEPTPFGLHDLQKVYETALSIEQKPLIVINRDTDESNAIEEWCKEENLEIIARIPHSLAAAKLYARGLSVLGVPEVRAGYETLAEDIKRRISWNQ